MTPRSLIMSTIRFDRATDAEERVLAETEGWTSVSRFDATISGREVRLVIRGEDADGESRVVSVCVGKISESRTVRPK